MVMSKQIKLYSINLGMAKTEKEKQLYRMKYMNEGSLYNYKQYISKQIKKELGTEEWTEQCSDLFKNKLKNDKFYITVNNANKRLNKIIKHEMKRFDKKHVRHIDSKYFREINMIAVFDNDLTRTLKLEEDELTLDFIVIEVGNTDMTIMEQILKNGLTITERVRVGIDNNGIDIIEIKNNKYIFFTAGAGQTRQEKFMMIKEQTWIDHERSLMCGLTKERINKQGGMNINKFNAYLSLNNSASEVVEGIDLDRCIVVDDFTEIINEEVDYITRDDKVADGETRYTTKNGKIVTRKKKKTEWGIKRQFMNVPLDFMDGAGICLPSVFSKNTQFRLSWFKGLLCPIDFRKYIKENKLKSKVTDIYGKEYDIFDDDIKIIFTKSQFKMWKNYNNVYDMDGKLFITGWEVYKTCFKYYKRTFNKCIEDEDKLKNMRINYQMLQTLTEISEAEIEILTKPTKDLINEVHSSRDAQLEFLGATLNKKNRSYMQEIVRLYPEILTSNYMKEQLKDTVKSFKKQAKSGRIKLRAKRVFIIPDLVYFMSILFGDGKDYALEKDEVYFETYKDSRRLALLRSPHLSREWAIKNNVKRNSKMKYFNTNGIYVNARDLMSKILMFDNDGDEALVVEDCYSQKWLLDLAEKQMKDLRPLYYEMGGGGSSQINNTNTYNSLKFVYEKSNIGKVSNTLTNIWSKDDCEQNSDNIKKLCAYNNWIIDSAKKLELPKLPRKIKLLMNNKTYPYFFQYAKNKSKSECRPMGNGVIDRICKSIDNVRYTEFDYSKGFGKFQINKLLNNKKIEIDDYCMKFLEFIEKETRTLIKGLALKHKDSEEGFNFKEIAYSTARKMILDHCKAENIEYSDFVDMSIKYSFERDDMKLAFVFNVFGAVIINNLNKNLELSLDDKMVKMCDECGKRIKINSNKQIYCNSCSKKIEKILSKKRLINFRKNETE